MKQMITASRLGLATELKWIIEEDGMIVAGVLNGGEEVALETREDLEYFYKENTSGVPLSEYFKEYKFSRKTKNSDKTHSQIMKQAAPNFVDVPLSKGIDPEEVQGIPEPVSEIKEQKDEEVSVSDEMTNAVETNEVFWRLTMRRGGEEIMTMEFEDEEDLHYRHGKWKEKYPSCNFEKQEVKAIVKTVSI
jgi:hypothetical protein